MGLSSSALFFAGEKSLPTVQESAFNNKGREGVRLAYLVVCAGSDRDAFSGSPVDGADLWSGVISHFLKCYAEDNGDADSFKKRLKAKKEDISKRDPAANKRDLNKLSQLFQTLEDECAPKGPLQDIGLEIVNQTRFEELTKDHLINRIASQAATYYQDIWQCCSNEERLTLFHLAQDRFLSPKDHDIEPLMRRGLIVHDPDLHLMNESFKRFVKNEKGAQVIANYEEKERRIVHGTI